MHNVLDACISITSGSGAALQQRSRPPPVAGPDSYKSALHTGLGSCQPTLHVGLDSCQPALHVGPDSCQPAHHVAVVSPSLELLDNVSIAKNQLMCPSTVKAQTSLRLMYVEIRKYCYAKQPLPKSTVL